MVVLLFHRELYENSWLCMHISSFAALSLLSFNFLRLDKNKQEESPVLRFNIRTIVTNTTLTGHLHDMVVVEQPAIVWGGSSSSTSTSCITLVLFAVVVGPACCVLCGLLQSHQ